MCLNVYCCTSNLISSAVFQPYQQMHRNAALSCISILVVSAVLARPAAAQRPFTLQDVLSAPFASELVAAPAGGKVAWMQNVRGRRNVWVAEPPLYQGRQITHYTEDDGKFLGKLAFTPDASHVLFVRGGGHTGAILPDPPNPTFDPAGGSEDIWIIPTAGGEPVRIDDGMWPTVSPGGDLVAYIKNEEIWAAPLTRTANSVAVGTPRRLFRDRGRASQQGNVTSIRWSPTGNRLSFISLRDQHSFIGVYDADANTLLFLDPSIDRDQWPEWSPDGTRIAFVRIPSSPSTAAATVDSRTAVLPELPPGGGVRRAPWPWSIRVADARTGKGREVWRAAEGSGSVFWLGFMNNDRQLYWGADDRIVFPWERTGWMHMYSVPVSGGPATELTPGEFEVEHVALSPNGRDLIFMSNQDDIDRRHLWRVSITSGPPRPVTTGTGIEYLPVFTSDGAALAFQATNARTPPQVELLRLRDIASGPVNPAARQVLAAGIAPREFPAAALVEPQQVIFTSRDGVRVHGHLYIPPRRTPGQRHPALVYLHGGYASNQQVLGYHYHRLDYYQKSYALNQYLAQQGYLVMMVNYRRGIGYGLNFREPEAARPGAPNREHPDVIDIVSAGEYLRGRPDVDPDRVGIWGGSAGGTRTILGLAFGSDVFAAGFDLHGLARHALGKTGAWKAPVLIVHGDDDRNVAFSESVALAAELRARGITVEQLMLPNEGHSFYLDSTWLRIFETASDFFERHLKNRATTAGSDGTK